MDCSLNENLMIAGMNCRFAGWGCSHEEAARCNVPSQELQEYFPNLVPCSSQEKDYQVCTTAFNQTSTHVNICFIDLRTSIIGLILGRLRGSISLQYG